MDKFIELKQIFKGIITDLGYSEEQVKSITEIVRTPQEMAEIVDVIDKNKNIKYNTLFDIVLNTIKFDIIIDDDKKDLT